MHVVPIMDIKVILFIYSTYQWILFKPGSPFKSGSPLNPNSSLIRYSEQVTLHWTEFRIFITDTYMMHDIKQQPHTSVIIITGSFSNREHRPIRVLH